MSPPAAAAQVFFDPLDEVINHPGLSADQRRAAEAVKSGKSIFVTGGAGVGKSWLSKLLIAALEKRVGREGVAVAASTGVAACQIGGTTLHRFCNIGSVEAFNAQSIRDIISRTVRNLASTAAMRKPRVLFLDEVSMVDGHLLDACDQVLRAVRADPRPMGGLQCIFVGDFFQLPPVWKDTSASRGVAPSSSVSQGTDKFAFESEVWRKLVPPQQVVELSTVFRQQGDGVFVDALNEIREGNCSDETAELLARRIRQWRSMNGAPNVETTAPMLRLVPLRRQADQINLEALKKIDAPEEVFIADDVNPAQINLNSLSPFKDRLVLKKGAFVILLRNIDVERGLVNGARGRVIDFKRGVNTQNLVCPVVEFENGEQLTIEPFRFSTPPGQQPCYRVQVPLDLAWAISIHKSQGITLAKAEVNLEAVFEAGQTYVALSRLQSLQGLHIQARGAASIKKSVTVHPRCKLFYENIREVRKRIAAKAAIQEPTLR